jgi:hypothetical protein
MTPGRRRTLPWIRRATESSTDGDAELGVDAELGIKVSRVGLRAIIASAAARPARL